MDDEEALGRTLDKNWEYFKDSNGSILGFVCPFCCSVVPIEMTLRARHINNLHQKDIEE